MAKQAKEESEVDIEPLKAARGAFEEATRKTVAISARNIGKFHTGRQRRALAVFTKLILHNTSISVIADRFLDNPHNSAILDHLSLAVLARSSIDAGLMTMYISEPSLTLNRWDFRRQLLFLHDLNNRSRFLKPLRKEGVEIGFFENSEEIRKGIQDKISELGAALLYSGEKIAEYQRGFHLFVDGVRGAAREAGWDIDGFEVNQSYLSAYVHSHPVSFMRFDEHEITFSGVSKFQADFCHYVLEMVAGYTQSVAERMDVFSVPDKGDPNGHLE